MTAFVLGTAPSAFAAGGALRGRGRAAANAQLDGRTATVSPRSFSTRRTHRQGRHAIAATFVALDTPVKGEIIASVGSIRTVGTRRVPRKSRVPLDLFPHGNR
jgi:hypothetical protein